MVVSAFLHWRLSPLWRAISAAAGIGWGGSVGRLFGRCPGWCGAGHGRGALRLPARPGRSCPALVGPARPPGLARRGTRAWQVGKEPRGAVPGTGAVPGPDSRARPRRRQARRPGRDKDRRDTAPMLLPGSAGRREAGRVRKVTVTITVAPPGDWRLRSARSCTGAPPRRLGSRCAGRSRGRLRRRARCRGPCPTGRTRTVGGQERGNLRGGSGSGKMRHRVLPGYGGDWDSYCRWCRHCEPV